MYDDILLPTDNSAGTAAAVEHASELASTYDATVHVLSVMDTRNRFESPSSGIASDAWDDAERERAEDAVADTAADLPERVETEGVVRSGVPRTVILEYAEEAGVDMIVMGTHGRTGLDHYLIGSVTEKVVRRAPVPVVSVRPSDD
ncbi:universal stress protein [Salarchaeum sp. JOR-1]|uniref:universal stress protein n=1 Tax=Salarchaeum sp. JOR-1 TaxID=2599399 RepID=UPI0011989FEA|nr:universal stress protein [Salarchaeum sp. JOR-1]QDX40183.1 universal stress protein [Salarchaeum sp. JOR-1]